MNKRLRKRMFCAAATAIVLLAAANGGSGSARAQAVPGSYRVADLFGESEEEKQARLLAQQHEDAQDASIRYLRQRNQDMESTIRRLTGQIEELDHRISEQNSRMEQMQKDFDYRLCKIAAMQMATSGDQAPLSCMGGESQPAMGMAAPPVAPPASVAPPGASAAIHRTPPTAQATMQPSSSANRARFDDAMKLLTHTQYDEARSAFRAFADAYPSDELAPQAVYWVGDIAYVQKDYPAAARAFAEEIKKYPDSARAPDSMLKLGQSLIAMGQKQEGCTALGALPTKYPTASQSVIGYAAEARKTAKCR